MFTLPGARGQTSDQPGAGALSDPEKRLQWLNARMPAKIAPAPKATPAPAAAPGPKVAFRSTARGIGTRPVEVEGGKRTEEKRTAEKPAPEPRKLAAEPASKKRRLAAKSPAKSTPAASAASAASAAMAPLARLTTPAPVTKIRAGESRSTPSPKSLLAPAVAAIPPSKLVITNARPRPVEPLPAYTEVGGRRYSWKTSIVTTVFWIGEPVGGNNFTPNHASSWDANWAVNYGGFDNPDPAARRNFIPVKFVPRQNPFYCALPYNDVTRGTTKPEARRVIPWFRDAFQREGQSVCRDRWVAIRNRAGKVVFAQWSDCGPFRTDHWQYVFGNERPKPNLNKGAGLDVSPAVRDYLGLSSTDVTDWKFVDFKDVPNGPWALYGQNNTFALQRNRAPRSASRSGAKTADASAPLRIREL